MDNSDLRPFGEALILLAEIWQRQISAELLEAYFEDLQTLTLPQAQAVLRQARRQCKYFPSIAELLEIAAAVRTEERVQRQLREVEAARYRLPYAELDPAEVKEGLELVQRLLDNIVRPMPWALPSRWPLEATEAPTPETRARQRQLAAQAAAYEAYLHCQPLTLDQRALLRAAGFDLAEDATDAPR